MARHFENIADRKINAGNLAAANFGAGNFTVALWCRFLETTDVNDTVFVSKRLWDGGTGWELKLDDFGAERIRWDYDTDLSGRQRAEGVCLGLTDGAWHLLVAEVDRVGGSMRFWFDGTLIDTQLFAVNGTVSNTVPLMIGGASNKTDKSLHATLAEVAGWNRLLNADEQAALLDLFSPRFFVPSFHFELIGNESPEPDFWGGGLGTLINAPEYRVHPPIIRPSPSFQLPAVGQPRPLAGSIDGKGDFAPNLGVDYLIYATIDGVATWTANISNNYRVEGAIDGEGDLDGFLSAAADLGGVIRGKGDLAGRLSKNYAVRGSIDGLSIVAGDLTTTVDIAGAIAGQSSISGKLAEDLHGQIDGQSTLAGFLSAAADLGGHIGGYSTISGGLTVHWATKGVIPGDSEVAGLLGTIVPIEGAIAGQSDLAGILDRQPTLAGVIDGASAISGDLSPVVPLAGLIAAQSTLSADLDVLLGLLGSVDGVSSLRGRLRLPGEVLTTSVGGFIIAKTSVGGFIVSRTPTGGWIIGGQQ